MADIIIDHSRGTDRRVHYRVGLSNLISYAYMDQNGNEIAGGMGTTLNISMGGVLLETYLPIESPFIHLTAVDHEENLIESEGQIVHAQPSGLGRHLVGISFPEEGEQNTDFLAKLVASSG